MATHQVVNHPSPRDVAVVISGPVPEDVLPYVQRKVAHAARVSGRSVISAHAAVHRSTDPQVSRPYRVEATLDVAGTPVRAEADGAKAHEAVDKVVDRLERRVTALIDRWQERSRWIGVGGLGEWRHGDLPTQRVTYVERPLEERQVVRRKAVALTPQTLDEAAYDLDLLAHGFHLFTHHDTGRVAVLHRLDDGRYAVMGLGEDADLPPDVVAEPGPADLDEVQARQRLDDGGEPFVFYADPRTGRGEVVYRRYDGHYGVVSSA